MKIMANINAVRAMLAQSRRQNDKAITLYEKAHQGGTSNIGAMAAYSLLLIRRGEFAYALEVALTAQKKADPKKPAYTLLRQNKGLALWKLGRLDKAIVCYESMFSQGETGILYGTLGFLYIALGDKTGDYEKALFFNQKACEYDEHDAVLLDNLAQTQMRLGQWNEAERNFRAALEIRSEQFDSMVCLARCLWQRNEKAEARSWIAQALERPFSHLNTVDRQLAERLSSEWTSKENTGTQPA